MSLVTLIRISMSRCTMSVRKLLPLLQAAALTVGVADRVLGDEPQTFAEALDPAAIRSAFQDATSGMHVRSALLDLAFVTAEDRDFFKEFPAWSNLTVSITRWYPPLDRGRGISGHMQKVQLSLAIANSLTHDEILAWYLAKIYLGRGCYGVESASLAYFGIPPDKLELEQVALLAALPKAPMLYDPALRPEKALERRNLLISMMAKAGLVTDAIAHSAVSKPLVSTGASTRCDG